MCCACSCAARVLYITGCTVYKPDCAIISNILVIIRGGQSHNDFSVCCDSFEGAVCERVCANHALIIITVKTAVRFDTAVCVRGGWWVLKQEAQVCAVEEQV